MTSPKRRKCFSIEEKSAIIHRLESGDSNSSLAKEFGVSHSTISTIFKQKKKIESSFNENVLKPKRLRPCDQKEVDEALLKWFKVQRNRGIPVSGPILEVKANFFASEFNIVDFNCTPSWVNRFKMRHNIVAGQISEESMSVDKNIVSDWQEKVWPNLRAQYTDEQIFNADETGLLYKLTASKTLKFKGETCAGGKLSKDRITVMVATNMSGSIKKNC